MKILALGLISILLATTALAKNQSFDHDHKLWTKTLKQFVVSKGYSSKVRYKQLKASPKVFNQYLASLSAVKKEEFSSWQKNQQMAFFINVYNAFTLKLIADNYPVKSIKDIGSFFSSPWKKKFFQIFGKKRYLDEIEHKILRKKYPDPRIHFAVNCASIGCPALRDEAFTAKLLDKQLTEQTKRFLSDKSRNYVKGNLVYVSKIFDWYEEDFTKDGNSVLKFVLPHLLGPKALSPNKYKLKFTPYSWDLNIVK